MLFGLSSFCGFVHFDLFSFIWFCACVSGTMLYLGMNGMLGWAWVTFLDCIGSLVSAQVDEGAPVYVTHAIPTPMHVLVRNGLPFHLYCLVRFFFTNLNADAYFLSPYDGLFFLLFFPIFWVPPNWTSWLSSNTCHDETKHDTSTKRSSDPFLSYIFPTISLFNMFHNREEPCLLLMEAYFFAFLLYLFLKTAYTL